MTSLRRGVVRPPFIPPATPAPLIQMTSLHGIRRALPIWAWGVVNNRVTMAEAIAAVTQAFLERVWNGRSVPYAVRVHTRIVARLADAVARMEALAERTAEDEGWRDDLADMRAEWDAEMR